MHPRAFTAGVLAIGVGATALPTDAWAGTGGHVAAPSFMARSAGRQTVAPHVAVSALRPLVRKPVNNGFRAPMNRLRFSQFRGPHERAFPFWWTYGSGAPYYYPDYYPPEYPPSNEPHATAYPPIENYPPQRQPVVTHEPGCRTDTQKVPSEAGGEATINIVRCY
jgi:hypothetical protein